MPALLGGKNIYSDWVSGNLVFYDSSSNILHKYSAADHHLINSPATSPTKTVRINSQTYLTDASIIGLQTKPRAGAIQTNDVIGIESMPGLGVTAITSTQGIVCFKAEPYIHATAGAITGDVRGFEVSLGCPAGAGTIGGVLCGVKLINNTAKAVTGGIYPFYAPAPGDAQAWSGFAKIAVGSGMAHYAAGGHTAAGAIKFYLKLNIDGQDAWFLGYDTIPT